MRIALNLLYLIPGVVGGTETYAKALIRTLAALDGDNEYIVFVNRLGAEMDITPASNFRRVVCGFNPIRRAVRYLWEQSVLPVQLRRERPDLVHSLGYVVPLAASAPQVVSVPDLNFLGHQGWGTPLGRRLHGFFVQRSVNKADHVITISDFSRGEIVRRLGVPEEKVTVVSLAAGGRTDARAVRQSQVGTVDIDTPYILAFSALTGHKNIARLVSAFKKISTEVPHSLLLVGHLPDNPAFREEIEQTAGDRVHFTGYLSDEEVGSLMQRASLFAFPSLYEGFGLPVLDAQQAGVPVACSSAAALPETAGKGACLFDPLSVEDIARALKRCLLDADLRARLIRDGYENVRRFSWDKTARETLRIYSMVAA
ncbi:MAG TPA: glycosyltransferase family 1 protein [Gemmatimonadaceae bacterium]|jgi:glycosyltransferase involved in cell wall biosynthesis